MLAGDEASKAVSDGLLIICVGWVVVESRSRRKAPGEQGMVSPASSSSSMSKGVFQPLVGV